MEESRRAVIAGLAPETYVPALRAAGFEPVGFARSADEALGLLAERLPDLLLADAVLPGLDGPALAKAALRLPLFVRPAVFVAAPRGLPVPGGEALARLNGALLEKPLSPEALSGAWAALRSRRPALPEGREDRLRALLDDLGVPAHPGREALSACAALAFADGRRLSDMKRRLYPDAARLTGMTPAQAERAMRYAIDAAWRTGAIEAQNRIFGDTIDARRGRPTCGEMIAQLADILRWEGRP